MRVRCLLISIVMVWLLSFNWVVSADIENLAKGGNFENDADLSQWGFHVYGGATGSMSIDNSTAAIGKASLFFEITKGNGWDPRPTQVGASVKAGGVYTLSAFLKAEDTRPILLRVQEKDTQTKCFHQNVTVGTDWQEYWATAKAPQDMIVELTFCNDFLDINYWIDGVRFYEGSYVPTPPEPARVDAVGKLTTTWGALKQ